MTKRDVTPDIKCRHVQKNDFVARHTFPKRDVECLMWGRSAGAGDGPGLDCIEPFIVLMHGVIGAVSVCFLNYVIAFKVP